MNPLQSVADLTKKIEKILPNISKNGTVKEKVHYLTSLQDQATKKIIEAFRSHYPEMADITSEQASSLDTEAQTTFKGRLAQVKLNPENAQETDSKQEKALKKLLVKMNEAIANAPFPAVETAPLAKPALPPIGIFNESGTDCFLNAILQFLFYIDSYRKAILQNPIIKDKVPELANFCLQILLDQLNAKPTTSARSLKVRENVHFSYRNVRADGTDEGVIALGGQEDASEFLNAFLRDVPETNRNIFFKARAIKTLAQKNNPEIADGEEKNINRPELLSSIPIIVERDEDLRELKLNEVHSFEDHLNYYFNNPNFAPDEETDARGIYVNGIDRKGKDGNIHKYPVSSEKIRFEHAPQDLVFTLKRFKHNDNRSVKLETKVAMPLEFDMPAEFVNESENKKYKLYAFVRHSGQFGFGHYYCFTKNSDETWCCRNDSSASPASEKKIQEELEKSYIYYYQLVDNTPAVEI